MGMRKLAAGLNISLDHVDLRTIQRKMVVNYWNSMGILSDEILAKVEYRDIVLSSMLGYIYKGAITYVSVMYIRSLCVT